MGVKDIFRTKHPEVRAWTREPSGELATSHPSRMLDRVFATSEVAQHLATRIGIHAGSNFDTDHLPVVVDMPNDCAGVAEKMVPVWDPVTVTKVKREEPSEQSKAEYSIKVRESLQKISATVGAPME